MPAALLRLRDVDPDKAVDLLEAAEAGLLLAVADLAASREEAG